MFQKYVNIQLNTFGYMYLTRNELDSLSAYDTLYCTVYFIRPNIYMLSSYSKLGL
jgi:hypothetical protein